MQTYENVVLHEDTPALTFHESCEVPDIVPVYLNFQEAEGESVGRALLKRDPATGAICADIYVDDGVDAGQFFLGTSPDSTVMEFEGVNYVMKGHLTSVSITTADVVAKLTAEDEHSPEPEPSAV